MEGKATSPSKDLGTLVKASAESEEPISNDDGKDSSSLDRGLSHLSVVSEDEMKLSSQDTVSEAGPSGKETAQDEESVTKSEDLIESPIDGCAYKLGDIPVKRSEMGPDDKIEDYKFGELVRKFGWGAHTENGFHPCDRIDKPHKCPMCEKVSPSNVDQYYHFHEEHIMKDAYVCEFSGKKFFCKTNLHLYQWVHYGMKFPDFGLDELKEFSDIRFGA